MACPFCSIMLKGAQASASKSGEQKPVVMTDLMTYVADRLPGVRSGPEDSGVVWTPGSS